jgi:hypothetical protein
MRVRGRGGKEAEERERKGRAIEANFQGRFFPSSKARILEEAFLK